MDLISDNDKNKMNNKLFVILTLFLSLFISSCQEDQDLITPDLDLIYKVKSTEILLRENTWGFNDLIVSVKYEMRAIPLLANVADENGMVQPGEYNAFDIFGNYNRQQLYSYQFTTTRINRDTAGLGIYDKLAYYNVLSPTEIRINPDSLGSASYAYKYLENEGLFTMTSDHLTNGKINEVVNKRITDAIYAGKPDDIANYVIDKILGNENIQASIQQLLYDLIHGKIDEIAQNPEEVAEKLASAIIEKLKEVDWESLVYEKLVELLGELKVDDPEQQAEELAARIADRIETSISQDDIYNTILPILQKFEDEALPKLVPVLADAVYKAILNVFSEENIYNKVYPLWASFQEVDSVTIAEAADTLGTVITHHFFDEESLAASLEPFIATLRETPVSKIPELSDEMINEVLMPLIDTVNAYFPSLDLDPDWAKVEQVLTSALTVLKGSIAGKSDAEAAVELAENIIGMMDRIITDGMESALFYLQTIPADQASQVIAAWINNLVLTAEPQIVAFLEEKLNEIAGLFNAEDVAEELSALIHQKILEVFSAENIYNLLLPLMEQLSEMNAEAVAKKIADWLTDLEILKDSITEEELLATLTEIIIDRMGNMDVDKITQKLVDLILQSEIVQNIDGIILKQLLEFKIYGFLIELDKEINAIDTIEISLKMK